ncbi:Tetratricopeptide repeat protein [Gimesia panareensis]|uniref:Tetratricopeptide repeat protein n=1 Tax=Gimesia panareensis TaxID=2527978 RepID=A0A518FTA7_9PLAN|nr:tetratricopeptide repeat protein [Gimesia panareensis]QDV19579.1 Tetratricopeptide repeat protein [Gimesia panareensis]
MRVSLVLIVALSWTGWWLTPDQRGQRLFRDKQYQRAAEMFVNPEWQGAAWYRAGEFEQAAQAFARGSSPEARFNAGNTWMLLGKYEQAIAEYERALKLRPGWKAAEENRALAAARAKLKETKGGDLGDQQEGADEVVFDLQKERGGQDTVVAGEQAASDNAVQAIWLRRVQTNPADFLRSKFTYQSAQQQEGAAE